MSLLLFLQVLLHRQLPSPTGPLSSSLAPLAIEEANAAVTSVREEAAAKKCGHYHHLSASVRAAIGKYTQAKMAILPQQDTRIVVLPNWWACLKL